MSTNPWPSPEESPLSPQEIAAELRRFEDAERARLELGPRSQYVERVYADPSTADKETTTILVSGLTLAQDYFVSGALAGLGFDVRALEVPDNVALRLGKEFGSRGQCNPTWYTVGNLIKHLTRLRDVGGIPVAEIIDKYVFLTAGSCGPCRFGMYMTEYRKALRDAGFDGFRVLVFEMNGGISQAAGDAPSDDGAEGNTPQGLRFDPSFFVALAKALLAGDVLNAMAYRVRPYEVEEGATNRALDEAKEVIHQALRQRGSLILALLRARGVLGRVKLDRTRVKPRVGMIGEFWAMTTEGDGSYKMQSFLESERAEVDVQLLSDWLLFMLWEGWRDTRHRMTLKQADGGRKGLKGVNVGKRLLMLRAGQLAVHAIFQTLANALGLHGYHLADMDEFAKVAEELYTNDIRGGEAHMEVAKVIRNVARSKTHMLLSLKPFGCMPSSGVSDGVQAAVTEAYPEAIFLPIETTGDGAVNVHSRVQMMLFRARKAAQREVDEVLDAYGMTMDDMRRTAKRVPLLNRAWALPPQPHAATAANVAELAGAVRHPVKALRRARARRRDREARIRAAMSAPA